MAWVLWKNARHPKSVVSSEMKAIEAKRRVDEMVATQGTRRTLEIVEQDYQKELSELDEKQEKKVARLRRNPGQLTRYLVRVGEKLRG